ncbi:MAG TPA: type IV secretion system protein VirB10 [Steroidobacteraceae bacterium]|nr:type IV secretion system protein VirB10 [Steroidobacteraceae bacterium]
MTDPGNPEPGEVAEDGVRGERTTAIVHAARSAQSRVSSLLAAGLMITLGLSALAWYYAHALTRVSRARQQAQSASTSRAQGEMPLPSLGRIEPPMAIAAAAAAYPAQERPSEPGSASPQALPIAISREAAETLLAKPGGPADSRAPPSSRGERVLSRRLSGGVLARESNGEAGRAAVAAPAQPYSMSGAAASVASLDSGSAIPGAGDHGEGNLAALLHAKVTPAVPAALLPTQRFLLPLGSFIDCTLETAIDSTLPGMTTCVTAADTYGADGKVVLLERGTKLVGETRGEVRQGQARVFVLWTQARTPAGVVVPLASPGTDELGRAGLPGEVDRHFWQRFGAGILITLIDGAVQAGVQASTRNGGTVIYAPSASQDVLTEVLKETVAIPPTLLKHSGDRIQVLVARDLDFRPVYELRVATPAH